MKIIFTKTGKYALDPVRGPVIDCIYGHDYKLPEHLAKLLIADGWAKVDVTLPMEQLQKPPWQARGWDEAAPGAKEQLQAYAVTRFKSRLDMRYSVKSLITKLKKMGAKK